jgi:hypothetical protein
MREDEFIILKVISEKERYFYSFDRPSVIVGVVYAETYLRVPLEQVLNSLTR